MKISRRNFFKNVAKILPVLALSIMPTVSVFSSPATDCKGGCAGTCTGLCAVGCTNACIEVVNIHAIRCVKTLVLAAWELVSLVAKLQQ